jgi:hypothetical protein
MVILGSALLGLGLFGFGTRRPAPEHNQGASEAATS